jgi:ubiquinone/menaquinone biosynthesis C-methylase UbiE
MEPKPEDIREQQKATWNKFSPGWKKWDGLTMDFLKPMGDEMIEQLHLKHTDVVLDVAAGTGEPGLSICTRVTNGKVVITDLAAGMLAVAQENAVKRGVTNVEFTACDVSELPFADNTFDAVSCRLGFMFFPDMLLAAKEMLRVLKPGGRVVTSVWHKPVNNFWLTAIMGPLGKNLALPAPAPGAPGMFRCAEDGLVAGLFLQAGARNVCQKEVAGKMNCKTADVYWQLMTDVAAPVVAALGQSDDATKNKIKKEVFQLLNEKYPDGNVLIDSGALVISGEK